MTVEEKLSAIGLTLPATTPPLASYVPAVRTGNLVYSSGQVPMRDGKLAFTGRVGLEVTEEDAHKAARICALNCLAAVKSEIGDLDRIVRVVRVTGYVASGENFTNQPAVINGASDLLLQVFGEAGRHSRAAVGVLQLPLGAPVEVDVIVEVEP